LKIIATNTAKPTKITFNGKTETTGIYKTPQLDGIYLGFNDVKDDEVSDRKHHGGAFKACYLFSEKHYDYWKNLYPNLNWQWGMFGENLTVKGLEDTQIYIGAKYAIGDAEIEITIPREPCYKLGVKFGSQQIINQFVEHGFPGTYTRILKEGQVKPGAVFKLIEQPKETISTYQFFKLLYGKTKNQDHLKMVLNNESIPIKKQQKLSRYLL